MQIKQFSTAQGDNMLLLWSSKPEEKMQKNCLLWEETWMVIKIQGAYKLFWTKDGILVLKSAFLFYIHLWYLKSAPTRLSQEAPRDNSYSISWIITLLLLAVIRNWKKMEKKVKITNKSSPMEIHIYYLQTIDLGLF